MAADRARALGISAPADDLVVHQQGLSGLERLDEDTLRLVAHETRAETGSCTGIRNIASVSRRLRALLMPVLFARCCANYHGERGVPPDAIRPFVRQLRYKGMCWYSLYRETFGVELPYLPALSSIVFDGDDFGSTVPWGVMERCLRLPHLRSVSWGLGAGFAGLDPYPAQVIANMPIHLTSFHYERPRRMWRMLVIPKEDKYGLSGLPPEQEFGIEFLSINPLLIQMHQTAESLRLMMESVDIARMAQVDWPNLREIVLSGELPSSAVAPPFAELIRRTPSLRRFSARVALPLRNGRLPILGRRPAEPWMEMLELRSLTLSYPDPADAIFCANMAGLKHLSLCDNPRYYYHITFPIVSRRYEAPILTSSECLAILKRMRLPVLESLVLCYVADEADEDLLRYVISTFPLLETLELHRYRKNRHDIVPHADIARLLSRGEMLRYVLLNLDFHDDHGPPGKGDWYHPIKRFDPIHEARGSELVTIMDRCALLQYVAVIRHFELSSQWVEYYPSRCAKSVSKYAMKDSINPYFEC